MLVEEEVADSPHEVVVSWVHTRLAIWATPAGGIVLGSEAKYALISTGRKPDLSVYFQSPKLPRHGAIRIPPDLMVEVLSPTAHDERRDRVEKAAEYAAFGVPWYWIVDPHSRQFDVFGLEAGHHRLFVGAAHGAIAVPGCDGLMLDLDALWHLVDEIVDNELG